VLTPNESELFDLAGPGCAGSIDVAAAQLLARGGALPAAMQWANAAAGLSVTRHGAIAGIPKQAEVAALLA